MKKTQTHITYGLVTALIVVVMGVAFQVMGLAYEKWTQWVSFIPFLGGLILNAMAYSKANDHYVTFGNVFSSGFKASAIVTIIGLVWTILAVFIFPEIKERAIEMASDRMVQQGLSDEQINQSMALTEKYFYPFMIGGVIFMFMFWGAVFSLIAAIFPKKKGERPPFQTTDNLSV